MPSHSVPGRSLKKALLSGFGTKRFEALKGVSLEVQRGEFVGLIGPNGSGKSTLFKLLSGIYPADSGRIHCQGRLAPLIELNAGFHPDLTGMENLYLNASILGLSRAQIKERTASILNYAGIGDFVDTPVRFYSNGMLSRLGFAINMFVDAEILLIDEVLAVGDESFQQQCLHTLRKKHESGVTIVFVSHDLRAIESETQRVIWLEHGRVVKDGKPADIVNEYRSAYAFHG